MEIPEEDSGSSERESFEKHHWERKFQENFDNEFGNAVPKYVNIKLIIKIGIQSDIKFGISIPDYGTTKIRIKFDKSIQAPSCPYRKYEFPIKTNLSEQTSGHDCVSEYVDNSLSDLVDVVVQYFLYSRWFPSS